MKHINIQYTPVAGVVFTKADTALLLRCSASHYDLTCKLASAASLESRGGHPGFLRGIVNCQDSAGAAFMHKLSWRELDTLVKILEVASMMRLKPQEVTRVSALRVALSNAMVALNQHAIPDKQL